MSKHDTSLSKAQQDLLKQFKKQISNGQETSSNKQASNKQPIYNGPQTEPEDDSQLFSKALQGVKPIDHGNTADICRAPAGALQISD